MSNQRQSPVMKARWNILSSVRWLWSETQATRILSVSLSCGIKRIWCIMCCVQTCSGLTQQNIAPRNLTHYSRMRASPFSSFDDICVDEHARGKHVGKALYEYVREYARFIGCNNITINVWEGNDAAGGCSFVWPSPLTCFPASATRIL